MSRLGKVGLVALLSAGALVVCAAAWIVAGNTLAAGRERDVARRWEAAFGPYPALVRRYTVSESNASARRAEEIAGELGADLTPRQGRSYQAALPFANEDRAAVREYVEGELARQSGPPHPAPPGVAELLASRRAALRTLEELLSSAPPPRWAFDASGSPDDWPRTMVGAHLHLQRLLVAQALDSSSKGEETRAARALEASWVLSQSLAVRPEVVSQMIATAVSRLDVGALRRIGGRGRTWTPRLAEMGSRRRLVDALVLEHGDPATARERLTRLVARQPRGWDGGLLDPFRALVERRFSVEYSRAWMRAIASLRDVPPFVEPGPEPAPSGRAAEIILAIALPNTRELFRRADRLALDAELTEKILQLSEEREARGRWPEPSPGIATSRFTGLSWNYRADGDAMTISLNRELPSPYSKNSSVLPLPLSFSSSPSRP